MMGLNALLNLPVLIQTVGTLGCLQEVELPKLFYRRKKGRKEEGGSGIIYCFENKTVVRQVAFRLATQPMSLKVSKIP
jgi:hypothetical protein